ncbi:hypothetical protein ACG2F4_00800 [Halalkalibaculum sp. DA3122]|uniref:hypothetical protein n=1 Tax=Halalkalibaculum sp. DA384 TaxID=3373606 RepID=UPI0037547123
MKKIQQVTCQNPAFPPNFKPDAFSDELGLDIFSTLIVGGMINECSGLLFPFYKWGGDIFKTFFECNMGYCLPSREHAARNAGIGESPLFITR